MRISSVYWLWGQFSIEEEIYLNSIKDKVQETLISPSFSAHMTLTGPYFEVNSYFVEDLKNLVKKNYTLRIFINGYRFKRQTYQSFYISIKNSNEINDIRRKIYNINKFHNNNNYEPHISLAYGNHANNEKLKLISQLSLLKKSLEISKLSLVEVNEDLNIWKVIESFEFKKIKN